MKTFLLDIIFSFDVVCEYVYSYSYSIKSEYNNYTSLN